MKKSILCTLALVALSLAPLSLNAQTPADYTWDTPSKNASESMPCGGGSIGMNVWVENGDILFYVCRTGSFDENNTILKQGRFRIKLTPALHTDRDFRQTLKVNDGYVSITDGEKTVNIWVDVYKPVIHVDVDGRQNVKVEARYENWRTTDKPLGDRERFQTSYKWSAPEGTVTHRDSISADRESVTFVHHNGDYTIFDATVAQQKMDVVKGQMYNPLKNLTFGGRMSGNNLFFSGKTTGTYADTPYTAWTYISGKAAKKHQLRITLATAQCDIAQWKTMLERTERLVNDNKDRTASRRWWNQFWQRSWIEGSGECEQLTRNYTLFRYMLGCNAMSDWPTKFNGGLMAFDPVYVDKNNHNTPDFRNWGGGVYTMQNQRLVYWPMLKSGDYDAIKSQFEFYKRIYKNAELRSKVYWNHDGAAFTEQMENYGLPNYDEYGSIRPDGYDPGMQYNAWLEYTWDTALEFCQMILESESYANQNISEYIPFIQSTLDFFNEHYRYLARARGIKELDGSGKLIIYPGSGAETFKMAYNSTSTVAGLKTVTSSLISYLKKHNEDSLLLKKDTTLLKSIPDISFREVNGHQVLSPAVTWARVNNTEPTELYPVFPWRIYGVGKPDLKIAQDTYLYDPFALEFRSHVGWKQDNIWAADLGLTDEAARLAKLKLSDGPYRFPAFWGPGFDWSPDHNWGGSGMIGMQDMLLQEANGKMILFPAWPKTWDVHFKLHASDNTTVEATLKDGKVVKINVLPKSRAHDIVISNDD